MKSNNNLPSEYTILETLRDYYQADVYKHALSVEIMLKNPMAFHDHDALYEGIESQLKQLAESKDYIDALDYVRKIMEAAEE